MIQNEVTSKTQGMVTTSTFKQTADSFSLCTTTQASDYASDAADGVEKKLKETGIIIDGNNREVKLIAGKVSFCDSSGSKKSYVQITNDGKIKATDVDLTGKITATSGSFKGSIEASSGSITGDITIGSGNNRITIQPLSDGARLLGQTKVSGSWDNRMGLGYDSSSFNMYFKSGSYSTQLYNNQILIYDNSTSPTTYVQLGVRSNGGGTYLSLNKGTNSFSINFNGSKVYLNSTGWPTEGVDDISALPVGTVHLREDGCLGVRR
jgi:hypothetical protein